jgi:CHAD domain-containing protein
VSRSLLAAMRSNEAGVDKDIDTEFLHDFRVAVRRQRSALTIFAGVFAPDPIDGFKREFAALGRLTGPLRDLDVYLLDEDRFRGLVPTALQAGLDGLFDDLRAQRRQALAEVRTALHAPAYRQLTTAWDTFLADPQPGPAAAQPVLDLARVRLRRRHDRVLRRGRAIRARTPASALHRLRIECKKLRYLLEFFAALFAAEDVEALVSRLKGLQDNLGEFNDLSVQQDRLRTALAGLPPRRQSSLAEAAALGGLVAALHARQQEVRREFAVAFDAFAGGEVAQRFAKLMGDDQEARNDQEANA